MTTREEALARARALANAQKVASGLAKPSGRGIMDTIKENVIGSGAVDTPGEHVGRFINQMGSGLISGAAGLADLAMTGGRANYEPATPSAPARINPAPTPVQNVVVPKLPAAETRADRFAQTGGSFLAGTLAGSPFMSGGASIANLLKFGLGPGLASEGAGQLTEGTRAEPAARLAAALLTPAAISGGASMASRLAGTPRPAPVFSGVGMDPEATRAANIMSREGVTPTMGQASGSSTLRAMEGRVQPTPKQIAGVTARAMRATGSNATHATTETISAAQNSLVTKMNNAVAGATTTPTPAMSQSIMRVSNLENIPLKLRSAADDLLDAATSPGTSGISLTDLLNIRKQIGGFTTSADDITREAAHILRGVIDDATDAGLTAAGRTSDLAALNTAREQYRNWLAVSDQSTRAGAELGMLSPTALNQAMIRAMGRQISATGRGTPFQEFTRSAAGILRQEPTVKAGGTRSLQGALPAGTGGAGAAAGFAAGGLPGAIAGGAMGAAVPALFNAGMRSSPMQSLMRNPYGAMAIPTGALPGYISSNSLEDRAATVKRLMSEGYSRGEIAKLLGSN